MTANKFVSQWKAGAALVGGVVVAVAALLLGIIATARSISSHAQRALRVAQEIVDNTQPIWKLEDTNDVAQDLLERARSIEQHATHVADQLEQS